ncbi:hypothetical protein MATL_G00259790 [Megalops atlanticus]|uniref:Uncharacterized protein n=1 Tax=Megalops atlanticus TaxID=7932 RepID=A0A9D3SVP4_MEGAT|nr:hypothetical protein MATL_G00259790 [Megalops atlanticus]
MFKYYTGKRSDHSALRRWKNKQRTALPSFHHFREKQETTGKQTVVSHLAEQLKVSSQLSLLKVTSKYVTFGKKQTKNVGAEKCSS